MKKIKWNHSDLNTSELCLGTVNYGTKTDKTEALRQMDVYNDHGGNFLDTAHVYGDWGGKERGLSEQVIGEWMKTSGKRSDIILASKGCHPPIEDMSHSRVNAKCLKQDIEESLRCLKTDYIDLYFLHRDDLSIPVYELLETLEEECKKGNIRYYGCSNWSLTRIKAADEYAKKHHLKRFTCNQMMYTMADVVPESLTKAQLTFLDSEFYDYHEENGMNFMAYMCLAGGYFAKKISGKPIPPEQIERYGTPANETISQKLVQLEREGYSITSILLQYVRNAGFPSVPIASFSTVAQLEEAITAMDAVIPKEVMDLFTCSL